MMAELPQCDVCGEPARWTVRDLVERIPRIDEKKGIWQTTEIASIYYFCDEHTREPNMLEPPDEVKLFHHIVERLFQAEARLDALESQRKG